MCQPTRRGPLPVTRATGRWHTRSSLRQMTAEIEPAILLCVTAIAQPRAVPVVRYSEQFHREDPDDRRARAAGARPPGAGTLAAVGAVPQRAAVGHRPRGLQRRRRRLGLPPARPCPQPGLPLGRGRHRRRLRRPAAALPRARPLERPRPDPQGAPLRPDQRRGQPRRGRQGALLLPRRHADALLPEDALQVSAAAVPLRGSWSRRTRRGTASSRSSSCSTPASSTTTATSTSSSNTPRPGRTTS